MSKVALTGIKPTGIPHIGNYLGAIKPALELTKEFESRYFIADYHAINTIRDGKLLKNLIYEIAAAWLSCGLDPEKSLFYRQSSVPETFELSTILAASTPKGLMNRAHAYKAVTAQNKEAGKDIDDGVNMGLFTYPILMAADILLFDTDVVPVGRDQAQHIEMTADIAQAFNYQYGGDILKIPQGHFSKDTEIVVGIDGRKMSKSYDNVIPLFAPSKQLRKIIMKIVTNSQTVEEPKNPDESHIFSLYKLFAAEKQIEALREKYLAGGMGWGTAKQELYEVIEATVAPIRDNYDRIMSDKTYIDEVLKKGSEKARAVAAATLRRVRSAVGID
ncbi:MAG: tryptophan--tRNA ligase [Candidatus Cloacimonetes bacterium]|nr:tryptophan--tRNA ligase [Candidatus Cloacimonadota bacterium]